MPDNIFPGDSFSKWLAKVATEDRFSLDITKRLEQELAQKEYAPIKVVERTSHSWNFGPQLKHGMSIPADGQDPILDTLKQFARATATAPDLNPKGLASLFLLFDEIDAHYHKDPVKQSFLDALGSDKKNYLLKCFAAELGSLDWMGNTDIQSNPKSIAEWRRLFRSLGYYSSIYDLSKLLAFLMENVSQHSSAVVALDTYLELPPLLKARIPFHIDLGKCFQRDPYEVLVSRADTINFVFASILSGGIKLSADTSLAKFSALEMCIEDKWTALGQELFTEAFSTAQPLRPKSEEDAFKERLKGGIAEKVFRRISDPKPRSVVISWFKCPNDLIRLVRTHSFIANKRALSDNESSAFYTALILSFTKTLDSFKAQIPDLISDSSYFNYFGSNPGAPEAQELFAHILVGLCICTDSDYEHFLHAYTKVLHEAKKLFYGEFEATSLAEAISDFFISIPLANINLTDPEFFNTPPYRERAQKLVRLFTEIVLAPYSTRLASATLRFDKENLGFSEQKAIILHLASLSFKKSKTEWLNVFRSKIENDIPIKWPWQLTATGK